MIYAEWIQNGFFQNAIFESWEAYHAATFSPESELLAVRVIGR